MNYQLSCFALVGEMFGGMMPSVFVLLLKEPHSRMRVFLREAIFAREHSRVSLAILSLTKNKVLLVCLSYLSSCCLREPIERKVKL